MTRTPKSKAKKKPVQTAKRRPSSGPPAAVLDVVNKLQGMSNRENARASWRQMAMRNHYQADLDAPRDRLTLLRAYQEEGLATGDPENIAFHVVAWIILTPDTSPDDPVLAKISAKMQAIEKREGLTEDESFSLDDAPEDYLALNDKYNERSSQLDAAIMREHGEYEMADLFLANRAEFDRRYNQGRRAIHPPETPEQAKLLADLEEAVAVAREKKRS